METITVYLDNLFASFPQTDEINHIKNDLLANMEERYHELKQQGKSENEAIGIVISEFGNIDELMEALEIDQREMTQEGPMVTKEEAETYLYMKGEASKWIGLGVLLCITGPAILLFLLAISDIGISPFSSFASTMIGISLLLICIAAGIGIFIYTDVRLGAYKYLEKGAVLSYQLQGELQQRKTSFLPSYTLGMIIGVGLLVLSPIPIFVFLSMNKAYTLFGVVFLLMQVATGVFILIYYGGIKEGYSILLQEEAYAPKEKEANRTVGAVAAVVWPLAVCIFLISGLVFHQWHINWIIFPITGILFGMFSGVYNILKGNDRE